MESTNHLLTPDAHFTKMKDQNENIQVFVRVRPINALERNKNSLTVVDCPGSKEVVVKDRSLHNITKTFTFDRVFGPSSKQVELYKTVVAPLLEEVLLGYNCTVFAYGQTGTGKTFTMEGERSNDANMTWENDPLTGIVPRALSQLFDELRLQNVEFTVRVSLLELYNEELFDLLSPSEENKLKTLRLFEDSNRKGSVIIQGLEEVTVHNKHEVYQIMERGTEKRKTAATQMNASSSRSHTVFTVTVHIKESNMDGEELLKIGKLHLVDLAGSENIGRSGAVDKRAREAGSINQSLLTLGRVITALVERAPHIPYRESKLTRLLQDSLGGRTKTSIIATVSPASYNIEETLSTLDYAHRAKNIMNRPEINQRLTKKAMLKAYTEEIERLRRDLIATREKNGVFMDKENYDFMTSQLDSQGQDLCEKITLVRSLQETLEHKEEELHMVKEQWEETKDDLAMTKQLLAEARAKYENSQQMLVQTKLERDQQEHLVISHVETEKALSSEAATLLETTEETTSVLDKIYRKLDRKKFIEQSNLDAGKRFKTDLLEQFQVMCSSLENFRMDHAGFCGEQRMKLDRFLQDKETQLACLVNMISNFLMEMKELVSNSTAMVNHEILCMEAFNQETKQLILKEESVGIPALDKLNQEVVVDGSKSLIDKLNDIENLIGVLTDSFKQDINQQNLMVADYVKARIERLDHNQQQVDDYLSYLEDINEDIHSSLKLQQNLNNEFTKNLKAGAEGVIEEMQKIIECTSKFNTNAYANFKEYQARVQSSDSAADDFRKNMMAEFDFQKVEAEALRTMGEEFVTKQNVKLVNDTKTVHEHCLSGAKSVGHVEKCVSSYIGAQKDRLLGATSWYLTRLQSCKDKTRDFFRKLSLSSDAINSHGDEMIESMNSGLNNMYELDMTVVGDGKTEMESHCNTFSTWAEGTRAHILQQSGKMGEFWESTYLQDAPTGMTPQKKQYDYPRSLSATSPHERILNRFTAKQEQAEKNEIF